MARNEKSAKAAAKHQRSVTSSPRPAGKRTRSHRPDPPALRVQYAIRSLIRISTLWARERARSGEGSDTRLDGALLDKIVRLVERREKSSPTGEGGARPLDAGLRHAVLVLADLVADMLDTRERRGLTRFDSSLLEDLHGVVTAFGFEIPRDVHDERAREWYTKHFKDGVAPQNVIKASVGKQMLAHYLIGALDLERGMKKSTQLALKTEFENSASHRAVPYRELAKFSLVCLGIAPPMVPPLADLLDKIHSGNATWEGDRALAPLKEALRVGHRLPKRLPRAARSQKPAGEQA